MDLLKWRSDYELGIPDLDAEHRQLLDLINQSIAALALKQETRLEPVLNQLFAYARLHFAHEERRMITSGYPELRDHINEHHKFYEKVTDLYSRFLTGDVAVATEIVAFLRSWLIEHIQGEDRLYIPYLLSARKP